VVVVAVNSGKDTADRPKDQEAVYAAVATVTSIVVSLHAPVCLRSTTYCQQPKTLGVYCPMLCYSVYITARYVSGIGYESIEDENFDRCRSTSRAPQPTFCIQCLFYNPFKLSEGFTLY
jgi:hypothetical protein